MPEVERQSKRKRLLLVIAVVLSLVVLETTALVSLLGLRLVRPERFIDGFIDSHFDGISQEHRQGYLASSFDSKLGWTNKPSVSNVRVNSIGEEFSVTYGADGARDDQHQAGPLLINTYGDSFTWCDEVNDDQTWQRVLEGHIDFDVKNFGVGAYGTGQSLLRFKEHLQAGNVAPITVLGIMEENVNRVVNSFRPFYNVQSGVKLGFKPYYRYIPGRGVEFHPNRYVDPEMSLSELRLVARDLAATEYWVEAGHFLSIRFPYSLGLTRATYSLTVEKLNYWAGWGNDRIEELNLWSTDEGGKVMHFLVADFVRVATASNSRPIVLFFPKGSTLRKGVQPKYTAFETEIRKLYTDLGVVDVFDSQFDGSRLFIRPYDGHFSVYGNQIVADALLEYLEAHSLPLKVMEAI